jgi:penicillin-binding protein 1A
MTAAFATFPNGGLSVRPRGILRVADADGVTVFDDAAAGERVISAETAFQMVSMLEDVVTNGTGSAARQWGIRAPIGGKTGTTNDFKDAWFVGFSSSIVAGVWVGFDQPQKIGPDAYGSKYALPIWADFMSKAARVRKPANFRVPTTVESTPLCRVSHKLPRDSCPTYTEYFKRTDVIPDDRCDVHRGPNAAEVIGGIFSKIGKGIGKIFGR